MVSYGLIAGLTLKECLRTKVGMVMDLWSYRQDYDDEQHGLVRGE